MGLPIWREPDSAKESETKPKPDLTAHHGQARSAIRRHPSVRISNNARNPYSGSSRSHNLRRALSRSPPPDPVNQDIPLVPELSSRRQRYREVQHEDRRARRHAAYNEARLTQSRLPQLQNPDADASSPHDHSSGAPSYSPIDDTLPDQYRPRRREARSSALDELPPLRRMGHRSINEGLPRISQLQSDRHQANSPGMVTATFDGLGDRQRSWSPEADQWETLLTTITPDASIPSAESSFDGANTSRPNNAENVGSAGELRPPQRPISALRDTINRRPGHRPRSPVLAVDEPVDDNCPPPVVPSQAAQLSFGEITRDADPIPPRLSTPPPAPQDESMPRSLVDPDRMPMIQQLLESQGESRDHHQRTHNYFTDFIRDFIRGERTESEAQLTLRAFDRLAHYMAAERTYHSTRMPERAQGREQDDTPRELHSHGERDEIDRWLLDHITDFDSEQRDLQEAVEEVTGLRELASRRPLDRNELERRYHAERFLGEAAQASRIARSDRVRRDASRGRGVQERL